MRSNVPIVFTQMVNTLHPALIGVYHGRLDADRMEQGGCRRDCHYSSPTSPLRSLNAKLTTDSREGADTVANVLCVSGRT